jgi:hypothetical protein
MPAGAVYCVLTSSAGARSHSEYPGGLFGVPGIAGMHRECALYSAVACKFLKYGRSRRRREHFASGTTRDHGAIIGFRCYGLLFDTPPTLWGQRWQWAYLGVTERIQLTTWRDLVELYDDAVAASKIDTSTRLYWREDSDADRQHLHDCSTADNLQFKVMRVSALTLVGGHSYKLAML